MAKIKLNGDTSGYIEISAPAVSGNNTLELGPGTKILTNLDNTFTGVSTFTSGLHITSGGFILNQQRSDTHTSLIIDKPDAGTGTLKFFNNGSASAYIQHTGAEHLHYYLPSGSGYHALYTNGTERLRITSDGKMGLGTQTPDATLKVNVASGNNGVVVQNTSTANIALFGARNGDATVQIGQWGSTASGSTFGLSNADLSFIYTTSYSTTHPSALALGTVSNKPIVFATNNTERLRIGSDGHLSYKNSSPPAWSTNSGYANATLGSSAYFRTDTDVNSNFFSLGCNAYRSSSSWQHVNSGWATQLQQSAHTGDLYYSSSSTNGNAGGTITWVEHFRITSAGETLISNSANRFLSLDRTNASSGSGEFNVNVENNSQTSISYDDGAPLVIGTSSSPRTQAGFSEKVRISSEGYVTKANQPSFFSRPPGNYNLSSGGNTIGGTWSNVHNIGSHFSNGTFTAPVAGTYQFSWAVFSQSETDRLDAYIMVNGTNVMREEINGYPSTAANKSGSVHGCYYLSANDNVTFGVYSAAGNQIYVAAAPWSYACGFLVG